MLRLPIQIYNMYHYDPGEELNNAFTFWFDYYLKYSFLSFNFNMNVPTIMHLTKNHIAHLCLFALMIPFLQSCLHEDIDHAKIREIEKQFEMEYIVINDTERDCSMEWFYDSLNGEDSRSQQIKAGEKWVVFGGDRREPYCAKRIVFFFFRGVDTGCPESGQSIFTHRKKLVELAA